MGGKLTRFKPEDVPGSPLASLKAAVEHRDRYFGIKGIHAHVADPSDAEDRHHGIEMLLTFPPISYAQYDGRLNPGEPNPLLKSAVLEKLLFEVSCILSSVSPKSEQERSRLAARTALQKYAVEHQGRQWLFPKGINAEHDSWGVEHYIQIVPWKGEALLVVNWPKTEPYPLDELAHLSAKAVVNGVLNKPSRLTLRVGRGRHLNSDIRFEDWAPAEKAEWN